MVSNSLDMTREVKGLGEMGYSTPYSLKLGFREYLPHFCGSFKAKTVLKHSITLKTQNWGGNTLYGVEILST